MVFQHLKKVKSVERWCFSIGRKSKVLNSGVSASGKNSDEQGGVFSIVLKSIGKKCAEQWCFSIGKNDEGLLIMVFQQQKGKAKQLLDGVVSSMKMVRKWRTGVFWEWEE
jgi:hypothetical protein